MSTAVDLVARHIEALSRFDWVMLNGSMSNDPKLILAGTADWPWTASTLYRMITKAWDYMPKGIELQEQSGGMVRALLSLEDGRIVEGMYHVTGNRIDQIILTDLQSSPNVG